MKKTNEEILDFLGLKVGDIIKIIDRHGDGDIAFWEIHRIEFSNGHLYLHFISDSVDGKDCVNSLFDFEDLLTNEYEIVTLKRVGDMKCGKKNPIDIDCSTCPLRPLHCTGSHGYENTLYEMLDNMYTNVFMSKDSPTYKAFKAELDKEVVYEGISKN